MAARDFRTRLFRRASRAGLDLPDDRADKLEAFYALLFRWNRKINLTSLTDPDEAIDRLIVEPLIAARYVGDTAQALMDVGSGGGSPAIPLKIALPRLRLTMVESKTRKSAFLREATRQLALTATQVENARVEELLTRADLHESFDLISTRAVRVEARVLHTLQAFLGRGGHLMLFRGPGGATEPPLVVPPLAFAGTYPLVETLQSRLTLLMKRDIGGPFGP